MPTNSKQLAGKKVLKHTQEERGGRRKRRKEKAGKVGRKEGQRSENDRWRGAFSTFPPLLLQVGPSLKEFLTRRKLMIDHPKAAT